MAHFCYLQGNAPVSRIEISLTNPVQLAVWGGGPAGQTLDIVEVPAGSNPILVIKDLAFLGKLPDPNLHTFEIYGATPGKTTLEARIPGMLSCYAQTLEVIVTAGGSGDPTVLTMNNFYHGTSLDQAKQLLTLDLAPMAVLGPALLEWYEYTDFGKGFYTHPEESKKMAVEWAKRKNPEWGVVRFPLLASEISSIEGVPLFFSDKFKTRPPNAPKLFADQRAKWIEFVEFNRKIRTSISRPKDNDWTRDYPYMRGPIWGRVDSGMPGGGPQSRKNITRSIGG